MAAAIHNLRSRAKRKGLDFNITKEDLLPIPEHCSVLGSKLEISNGRHTDNSPSVDRIDNNKGYTKDNVRVISSRANFIKNNMTLEECRLLLKDFEKNAQVNTKA